MSEKENKDSNSIGVVGSAFLGFVVGNLIAGKKKVAGSHSSNNDRTNRFVSGAKQKYRIKRDELYLAGLKRDERIQREKNKLQSEARQKAIKEVTLHKNNKSG